jgi:hypothetical protein
VTYKTTPAMLEAARSTWHELDQMPGVKATFYGEGLVQHMARNYKPNPIAKEKSAPGLGSQSSYPRSMQISIGNSTTTTSPMAWAAGNTRTLS